MTGPDPRRAMPPVPKKIVVIAGFGWSLVNFRLELLKRMVANGHDVLALAPDIDDDTAEALAERGIRHATFPLERTGTNPLRDLGSLRALIGILRRERPDVILPYTMKPIVYGCLAALFTGLGYAFVDETPSGRRRLIRNITILLHRLALRRVDAAFFYNPSEERDIRRFGLVPARTPLHPVAGSGVDTHRFAATPPPIAPIRFLMIARLLKSKGVPYLAEAARHLKARHPEAEVCLLGPFDSNPDAVTRAELEGWVAEGALRYLGETRDVRPHLREASVFVLPTVLREGVPRTILEAMSSGRAVIASDAPGCDTAVIDGETGFVVPRHDAEAVADAMARFCEDPSLAVSMGAAARARACEVYDVHKVNRSLLTRMGLEDEGRPPDLDDPQPKARS